MRVPKVNTGTVERPRWEADLSSLPAKLRQHVQRTTYAPADDEYEITFVDAADLRATVDRELGLVASWGQPTGAHDAYDSEVRPERVVKHQGKVWESTTPNNVWEPGVSGWAEIGVALPDMRERIAALADIRGDVGEDAQAIIDVLTGADG